MTQYLLLIQGNARTRPTTDEWDRFFAAARATGWFQGGSALGSRTVLGETQTALSSAHLVGYMRFDSDDRAALLELLRQHPIVIHGGSVELCEMPQS
jgi:hypothetical protein